jgi:hypothetical protein
MIKLKSLISEKTLYHGTLIDNVPSIQKIGLMPTVGEFVKDAYDVSGYGEEEEEQLMSDYLKELVFATDKQQLDKAATAITAQIAKKLGKGFHDVTDGEFVNYGAVVKIYDGESVLEHRPEGDENRYSEYPYTVEPGDYYSHNFIGADEILTGTSMIRLLKRYGVWPRVYSVGNAGDEKWLKNELMRLALKHHKDIPKEKILSSVINLSKRQLIDKIQTYRDALGEKHD